MYKFALLALLSLNLIACNVEGGRSSSDDSSNDLTGYWYNAADDSYIEIEPNGDVSEFDCTVNEGYQKNGDAIGTIIGNQLTISDEDVATTVIFTRNGDALEIASKSVFEKQSQTITTTASKANSIPTSCQGDAIEITETTPTTVIEGQETEFVVNFDYRLASTSNATIYFLYTDSEGIYHYSEEQSKQITSKGTDSGSFTINLSPETYNESEPYNLMVELRPRSNSNIKTSSDKVKIDIQPSPFSGHWYNSKSDYYLEIKSNGEIFDYYCTVNNGYQTDGMTKGTIEGNQILLPESDPPIYVYDVSTNVSLNDNIMGIEFTLSWDENIIDQTYSELEKSSQIPAVCTGDAIEITYASPTTATAGQETQFVVNFDYRLASDSEYEIAIRYVTSNGHYITPNGASMNKYQKGTGSSSFTFTLTPFTLEKRPFKLELLMTSKSEGKDFPDLAALDAIEIEVQPATAK